MRSKEKTHARGCRGVRNENNTKFLFQKGVILKMSCSKGTWLKNKNHCERFHRIRNMASPLTSLNPYTFQMTKSRLLIFNTEHKRERR